MEKTGKNGGLKNEEAACGCFNENRKFPDRRP
jgi:hypothetical protein